MERMVAHGLGGQVHVDTEVFLTAAVPVLW